VDNEIFLYNGSSTVQLTTNSIQDVEPKISGTNVVWASPGGSDGGVDNEIFLYNGSSTVQLTTNSIQDVEPKISGENIVWFQNSDDGFPPFKTLHRQCLYPIEDIKQWDADGNNKVGLPDAINALKISSGN